MKIYNKIERVLFAAGGTGGHLFPALSVANELLQRDSSIEFLFVGNKNKIEGTQIPKIGFRFEAIPIIGMPRKLSFKFIVFIFKFLASLIKSYKIIKSFKPTIVFGTGGYISVAPLIIADLLKIPNFMLEPNLYPGVATKLLSGKANRVYLSFEQSADYLKNKSNILVCGTPVRINLNLKPKEIAAEYFKLSANKKTILVLGGSLGAKSINEKILSILSDLTKEYQIIWQCGKFYIKDLSKSVSSVNVYLTDFIDRMDLAYSLADLIISRAGASTISELTYYGLPSILIPSPNVAENHQYHNAKILADNNAAFFFDDNDSSENLLRIIIELLKDDKKLNEMKENSKSLAKPNASQNIVDDMYNIINTKEGIR